MGFSDAIENVDWYGDEGWKQEEGLWSGVADGRYDNTQVECSQALSFPNDNSPTYRDETHRGILCGFANSENKIAFSVSSLTKRTPIFYLVKECFRRGKNEEGFLFYITHTPRRLQSCCSPASPSSPASWRPRDQVRNDRYLPPEWSTNTCYCPSTRQGSSHGCQDSPNTRLLGLASGFGLEKSEEYHQAHARAF